MGQRRKRAISDISIIITLTKAMNRVNLIPIDYTLTKQAILAWIFKFYKRSKIYRKVEANRVNKQGLWTKEDKGLIIMIKFFKITKADLQEFEK